MRGCHQPPHHGALLCSTADGTSLRATATLAIKAELRRGVWDLFANRSTWLGLNTAWPATDQGYMATYVFSVLKRFGARPVPRGDRNVQWLMLHTTLFGVVNSGVNVFLPILLARLSASVVVLGLLTLLPALLTMALALSAGAIATR